VIQQRDTELDGIRHGHFVGFHEEIVRQPGFCVHVKHFAERSGAMAIAKCFVAAYEEKFLSTLWANSGE